MKRIFLKHVSYHSSLAHFCLKSAWKYEFCPRHRRPQEAHWCQEICAKTLPLRTAPSFQLLRWNLVMYLSDLITSCVLPVCRLLPAALFSEEGSLSDSDGEDSSRTPQGPPLRFTLCPSGINHPPPHLPTPLGTRWPWLASLSPPFKEKPLEDKAWVLGLGCFSPSLPACCVAVISAQYLSVK